VALRLSAGAAAPATGRTGAAPPPDRVVRLPAVVLPAVGGLALPTGVISAEVARRLGLVEQVDRVVIATSRMPTEAEEDRARAALEPLNGSMEVERGYGAPYLPGFVALIGGAGLVTLAGVAISVALSAAEGRADLATLAAVGAPPRRRRGLAMTQAALVAGLGAGLGVALGAAIGTTVMSGLDGYPLVVPWPIVLLVGVGVPALGVLVVGLVTRSRLPLVRRLG
jgi:putative ABC transport system permease protein